MLLLGVSYLTRRTDQARIDLFYGKMKTPVAETPEGDVAEMELTRREPGRFNGTKLFPGSDWEFTRWTRLDTVGFFVCCAISGAIIGLFALLLNLASGR